jgi:hypothetical protein
MTSWSNAAASARRMTTMVDPSALRELDEVLTVWESGALRARAESLLAEVGSTGADAPRASSGEGRESVSDEAEALAAIDEFRAHLTEVHSRVTARFGRAREELAALVAEIGALDEALGSAAEASHLATRDLQEAVARMEDDAEPSSEALMERQSSVASASEELGEELTERVAAIGSRVTDEWLPALHEAVHGLDQRLAEVEGQLGAGGREAGERVRRAGDDSSQRVEAQSGERVRTMGAVAGDVRDGLSETGEAARTTGTTLSQGKDIVQEAGNATSTGLRTALEVLDELLELFQRLTRSRR